MLSFFKTKVNKISPGKELCTDVHSHILPGIDDGAATIEVSLHMLRFFQDLGYRKVITTPHIKWDSYPNTIEIILDRLKVVRELIHSNQIPIEIEAAAEYYLDEQFEELLDAGELLTFGKKYLLFETSHIHKPFSLIDSIQRIKDRGYIPVFAHPERYAYAWGDMNFYVQLRELGVYFQANINSFSGYYTPLVQRTVGLLATAGMIDMVGSDAHNIQHLEAIRKASAIKSLQTLIASGCLLNSSL